MSHIEILKPGQAADRLNITPRTLQRWADRGLINVIVLPSGHRRYPVDAVDAIVPVDLDAVEAAS